MGPSPGQRRIQGGQRLRRHRAPLPVEPAIVRDPPSWENGTPALRQDVSLVDPLGHEVQSHPHLLLSGLEGEVDGIHAPIIRQGAGVDVQTDRASKPQRLRSDPLIEVGRQEDIRGPCIQPAAGTRRVHIRAPEDRNTGAAGQGRRGRSGPQHNRSGQGHPRHVGRVPKPHRGGPPPGVLEDPAATPAGPGREQDSHDLQSVRVGREEGGEEIPGIEGIAGHEDDTGYAHGAERETGLGEMRGQGMATGREGLPRPGRPWVASSEGEK